MIDKKYESDEVNGVQEKFLFISPLNYAEFLKENNKKFMKYIYI